MDKYARKVQRCREWVESASANEIAQTIVGLGRDRKAWKRRYRRLLQVVHYLAAKSDVNWQQVNGR